MFFFSSWVFSSVLVKQKMQELETRSLLYFACNLLLLGMLASPCQAANLQAPRFVTQPSASSSIVSEGRTKILQCQALGYPQPKYRWIKDGQTLGNLSTEYFYRILNTRRDDAGNYQCVAQNDVGAIFSEKIDVTVAYMGVFENADEEFSLTVTAGQAAILELPPLDSLPPPAVTWQSEQGPLSYSAKYAVTKHGQLVILSTEASDSGSYRARATNTQLGKEENSAWVRLKVESGPDDFSEIAPEIVIAPESIKLSKGESIADLQCIGNARPLHEVVTLWLKDGIPIETSGVSYTFNDLWNRSLSLIDANLTHTGRYTCQLLFRTGGFPVVTAAADVIVMEKPRFVSPAKPETLVEFGTTIYLPCEAVGVPNPNIFWFRNTERIEQLSPDRYSVDEDGSLIIKRVRMEDTGIFQCLAANEAGEDSSNTWLKVKTTGPVLETVPQNATILAGQDVTLSCRAAGAPTPNTTWTKTLDNEDQPETIISNGSTSGGRIQVLEHGDLLIAAVREEDAGAYTCTRANEAGQIQATAYLSVLVRTQITQPPADTKVLLGQTATLQCKVSSDRAVPYELSWQHNDEPVIESTRISIRQDGTLEIQAVRAADVGDYKCIVTSLGGDDTRIAKLSVLELPYAPLNVRASRITFGPHVSRGVNVTWTPGFDGNSPTLKFIIQRREVSDLGPISDASWMTELSNVSTSRRWVLLDNLKAASSYQFRVSAVNSVGEGSPSDPSNTVTLPQEAPSGPPLGLVGSARSPSEIITQWQPPSEEHRNGQILGYMLRYRLYGYNVSPWTYKNVTNEAQRSFLIQDLITWKDYVVQVAAYNNKGVGDYSEDVKIKTREGVPEAPPSAIKVVAINSTAVKISWKPPDPQKINGINQGYKIEAHSYDIERNRIKTVPPSLLDPLAEQTANFSGLDKYTEYNITVLCFTDPGDGKRSEPVSIRTLEDVPDQVASLQFDDVSDRAVRVIWTPPTQSNGILTSYQLRYQVRDKPSTMLTHNLTADTHELLVEQLQATTHYRFEVAASTESGLGPPRVATIQSGIEPVLPEPPTKLAVSNIEPFSVVLQFTPGFDGNSSITKWIIEAQTARNTTWSTILEVSDPEASTLTVTGLAPFMQYSLRLIACNVVGLSRPSEPTKAFQTIQAPPAHAPKNVTVRAMSATQLRVRWIPLQQTEWYGNPRGYNISYRQKGSILPPQSVRIEDPTANSHVLGDLEEFALYEIVTTAFNDVGPSVPSPPAIERTREAVPSHGPLGVVANATSSTTIVVRWNLVPEEHRNGLIEGFKVYYGSGKGRTPFKYKSIPGNSTTTTTLTELRKFITYHIQVLAYTRLGDGSLSVPPVRVQTLEDVPGAPSNVSFPDVSLTSSRIIWDVPEEPNGLILAYRVTYSLDEKDAHNVTREFVPSDRTYRATDLQPERYYKFSVSAQTRLGWGQSARAVVFTTNSRERPEPPSAPQISRSQLQSDHITLSWTPGRDGFAPLRYYTLQRTEGDGPWLPVQGRVDPELTSFTVGNLKPYTSYRFRIQATNDLGPSGWSQESVPARTFPASPNRPITGLRVVPITTTSVRVTWQRIDQSYWNGDYQTAGYRVLFQPVSDFPSALQGSRDLNGYNVTEVVLEDLARDKNYEIIVVPYNSQGEGPSSPPATVYVGEAVPTGQPLDVKAESVSSTEVRLSWRPPQQVDQNGDLLGYKVFYLTTDSPNQSEGRPEEELEIIPATSTDHSLVFLDKWTQYRIQMLAFNPAGDGPRSSPITVRTHEGLPGPPTNLQFSEITLNTLRVNWDPPSQKNGQITGYVVAYETAEQNEHFSKQVKETVTATTLLVSGLEEQVAYSFSVRAQTYALGPPVVGNVTTGPQEGSPGAPRTLTLTTSVSSVDLRWLNGPSGKGVLLGYYIQCRRKDDNLWQTVTRTANGLIEEFSISYQSLLPSTSYTFRVIAYNAYGVSLPVYCEEAVLTPSKLYFEYGYLQHQPFYRQTWFMVALAATSIIIIIMIIAVLCVKSKSYKYKQEAAKVMEESMVMDADERHELAMELYRRTGVGSGHHAPTMSTGGHGTLGKQTLSRRQPHPGANILGKSPPRPSPASVAYHSDEESLKGYDENPDDSSVTEKPSELSSTDSQPSESDNESVRSDPHSFVNHYANVNDSLRQSWKRQKPVRNYSSYTDSEPEGSAVMSLNGGQIIMNNMARSRAPLPGFSSFV